MFLSVKNKKRMKHIYYERKKEKLKVINNTNSYKFSLVVVIFDLYFVIPTIKFF